jgi:group I intron endonuclease
MLIYKITNKVNRKIYIGKTKQKLKTRWKKHLTNAFKARRKAYLYCAIRKYGVDSFTIECIHDNINDPDDLNNWEKHYIKELDSRNHDIGYNLTEGGDGGFSEEAYRKAAEVRRRNGVSEEHKEILREAAINLWARRREEGWVFPEEAKIKISNSLKEKHKNDKEFHEKVVNQVKSLTRSGVEHNMWGKSHTDEAKAKISAARMGKSYEEILGVEKAEKLKEEKRKLVGNKNPNYKEVEFEMLKILVENPTIKRNDMCDILGCSPPTLIKRFKKFLGINNLQKFRYGKTNDELKSFFEDKLIEIGG